MKNVIPTGNGVRGESIAKLHRNIMICNRQYYRFKNLLFLWGHVSIVFLPRQFTIDCR